MRLVYKTTHITEEIFLDIMPLDQSLHPSHRIKMCVGLVYLGCYDASEHVGTIAHNKTVAECEALAWSQTAEYFGMRDPQGMSYAVMVVTLKNSR